MPDYTFIRRSRLARHEPDTPVCRLQCAPDRLCGIKEFLRDGRAPRGTVHARVMGGDRFAMPRACFIDSIRRIHSIPAACPNTQSHESVQSASCSIALALALVHSPNANNVVLPATRPMPRSPICTSVPPYSTLSTGSPPAGGALRPSRRVRPLRPTASRQAPASRPGAGRTALRLGTPAACRQPCSGLANLREHICGPQPRCPSRYAGRRPWLSRIGHRPRDGTAGGVSPGTGTGRYGTAGQVCTNSD